MVADRHIVNGAQHDPRCVCQWRRCIHSTVSILISCSTGQLVSGIFIGGSTGQLSGSHVRLRSSIRFCIQLGFRLGFRLCVGIRIRFRCSTGRIGGGGWCSS